MPRALAYRRAADAEPFSALNITPLIDVMLVLLIMLIVTIPSMTHKVPVDLPQGDSVTPPGLPHRLDITADGSLLWDGARMTDAQLPGRLAAGVAADRALLIQTDEATRYARFDDVLAQVKRAGVTKLAFVGNERMKID
ncbi:ExbD/TolR family protein [Sphingomonas sp.]|jgi:biopolymer transport protein ExbD|uniref:ExbD/TolR family protein n=1 Tax=Sphingomonas sp. TaxID=28214 RepID=UPI0026074689|nr:biopolymer transporter ExbD [Sphingomonas sp.]MDK2768275.1 biopolymer transporter ExbD [Sphingomonas sp.]